MNIVITINAPELVAALEKLAIALQQLNTQQTVQETYEQPVRPIGQSVQPIGGPAGQPAVWSPPIQTVQQPVVPTQPQGYTQEQLSKAAVALMDSGKREGLINLLQQFGVNSLNELPEANYGHFATGLRGLGALI